MQKNRKDPKAKSARQKDLKSLEDRWYDLREAIRVRGIDYADDPLGRTGYFTREFDVRDLPGNPHVVEAYTLDRAIMRELDALERQIASERGDKLASDEDDHSEEPCVPLKDLLSPEQIAELESKLREAWQEDCQRVEEERARLAASGRSGRPPVTAEVRMAAKRERLNVIQELFRVRGEAYADDPVGRTGYFTRKRGHRSART